MPCFFVSDIQYADLEEPLAAYEIVYHKLFKIVYDLESEQISKGVGMTTLGEYSDEDKEEIELKVLEKIKKRQA